MKVLEYKQEEIRGSQKQEQTDLKKKKKAQLNMRLAPMGPKQPEANEAN